MLDGRLYRLGIGGRHSSYSFSVKDPARAPAPPSDLIDPLHRNDFQTALHIIGNLLQILDILFRNQHGLDATQSSQQQLSLRPPIAVTSPRKVISPVMATSARTGMPVRAETKAVVIAAPALGPSLGVAPSGTCTWMSFSRRLHP
jgi:hypothetical protein